MGNIEWFSFKRNVEDDEMDATLREVVSELFGTNLEVQRDGKWGHWSVLVHGDLVPEGSYANCFSLYREGPRKFGGKMGRSYREWLRMTILEAVAARLGHATFSNEGISDTWKPEPLKYPTYRDYLEQVYYWGLRDAGKAKRILLQTIIKKDLERVPEELQQVRGEVRSGS